MKNIPSSPSNITFAQYYGIKKENYINIPIDNYNFSQRTQNYFTNNGITTVYTLLSSSKQSFSTIKGIGNKLLKEIEQFCIMLKNNNTKISSLNKEKILLYLKFLTADIPITNINKPQYYENEIILFCNNLINLLGEEFVYLCIYNPISIHTTFNLLSDLHNILRKQSEFMELVERIPKQRKNNKAYPYIFAFTVIEEERQELQKLCSNDASTLLEMIQCSSISENQHQELFIRFLRWCTYNINNDIEQLLEKSLIKSKTKQIIRERAQKITLEKIGKNLGLTRERIRQIEAKAIKNFSTHYHEYRIIQKISAENNGEQILVPSMIEKYCGQYLHEFFFFLQHYENTNYTYDEQLDIYILEDDSIFIQVYHYLEHLPDIIKKNQLMNILNETNKEYNIPFEILEKAFFNTYKLTNNLFHRNRLQLANILQKTIETHYPHGIKIYDPIEIKKLREIITTEYGNIGLPTNDRALAARITKLCILCNKGTYKIKEKYYFTKELKNKIHNYILETNYPVFNISTLYNVFEKELNNIGITNRYYFQGILHELFANEFIFKKDYILKDPNTTHIYSAILNFIKNSEYPVTKTQIQREFTGISDVIISLAVNSTPNILNFFGEYLWTEHLSYSESEKNYLQHTINKIISDQKSHHIKDFYEIINSERPEILKRNAIRFPFSAFSFLEYLFINDYQFSRPYIAPHGVEIGYPAERLHDLIYSSEEFELSEISEFAKQNHFQIQSILDFITTYNDTYLLINSSTLMKIEKIGITSELANGIDDFISSVITETMPINELTIWYNLPQLKIPWTDWLLYSIIKKWGKKLTVATSSNQFRHSVPLIAPINKMDVSSFINLKPNNNSVEINKVDNIDLLLEDVIDDTIWDEDNEF